jgi:hypothetical protein
MLAARFAVIAMFCFSICATAQTRTLAVYPGDAAGLDSLSKHAITLELQRVLAPAGLDLEWRTPAEDGKQRQDAGRLVVGSFDGNCSVETLPHSPATPMGQTGVLAETAVSNNRILPYFRVDCTRIIRTLAPTLGHLSVPFRSEVFGRAVARVIAHEIYHILAQTADHEASGLAKSQLSREELISSRFDLSPASLRRMQASFPPGTPGVPSGGLVALGPR